MKKILESFKSLYKGQNVVKTHIWLALMFFIPGLLGATLQFLDKDFKEYMIPVIIASVFLSVLSIIPILFLTGFYLKFVNKRLREPVGIPDFNLDCFIQGVKAIPVVWAWILYCGIPVVFVSIISFLIFILCVHNINSEPIVAILAILGFLIFMALVLLYSILVSPFIQLIYITYADNFEYSKKVFNPIVIFSYMKKSFKETIIVALKFIVVNFVVSMGAQIIGVIFVLLGVALGLILTLFSNTTSDTLSPVALVSIILFASFGGIIHGYAVQIVGLSYADNLIEIYKSKIEDVSAPGPIKSSDVAINNEEQSEENETKPENEE